MKDTSSTYEYQYFHLYFENIDLDLLMISDLLMLHNENSWSH